MDIRRIHFHIPKDGNPVEVLVADTNPASTWFKPDPATLHALYAIAFNYDPKPHINKTVEFVSLIYNMKGYQNAR